MFSEVVCHQDSSRIYAKKYGLVYSIGAGHSAYIGTGTFDISAGMSSENVEHVAELITAEIKRIKEEKLSDEEIERAKIQLRGNYILANENVGARMQSIGRTALLNKPLKTQDEVINKIMAVTAEDTAEIIDRVLDTSTLSVVAAGPIDSTDGMFVF